MLGSQKEPLYGIHAWLKARNYYMTTAVYVIFVIMVIALTML